MKVIFSKKKKWTFWRSYRHELIFIGIPLVLAELIGVPIWGWTIVLGLAVPVTLVGLLAYTLIVHLVISALPDEDKSE